MKKKTYFQIALLFVLLNYFIIINAIAVDYNLELSNDANLIWRVDKFDEDTYDDIFEGYSKDDKPDADFDEGDEKQIKVKDIDTREKKWVISYDQWDYTDDNSDFSEEPDDHKYKTVYKDPEDAADEILVLEDIVSMWIIPSPFLNYIEEFRDEFDNPVFDVSVEDEKLIAKGTLEIAEYEIEITYNNDGLFEKIEYIDKDGDTFIKIICLEETIPGYNLILILLIICGFIGIILWKKNLLQLINKRRL